MYGVLLCPKQQEAVAAALWLWLQRLVVCWLKTCGCVAVLKVCGVAVRQLLPVMLWRQYYLVTQVLTCEFIAKQWPHHRIL